MAPPTRKRARSERRHKLQYAESGDNGVLDHAHHLAHNPLGVLADGGPIPERFWQLSRRWTVAGIIASLLPLGSLVLMVLKP